jgi:hypothetical protein
VTLKDYVQKKSQVKKLRLREIAAALDVSAPHVHYLCSGGRPSLTLAQKIIAWSNGAITLDDLVGGAGK